MKLFGRIFFGILISAGLLFLLLNYVSVGDVANSLSKFPFNALVISFFLYLLIFLLKTLRFWTLLSKKIRFSKLFSIVCVHNFTNVLLPFRTGELGYAYLVKKEGMDYPTGLGTLIVARLFDIIAIFIVFFTGYLLFRNHSNEVNSVLLISFLAVAALFVLVFILIKFKDKLRPASNSLLCLVSLNNNKAVLFVQKKIGQTLDAIRGFGLNKNSFLVLIESVLIWGLMFYFTYFVLRSLGMEIGLVESIIGSGIALLIVMLPIQGIAGFGTTEAAIVIGFLILGFERDQIILVSFGYHILSLVYALILGAYGIVSYSLMKSKIGNANV